MLAGFVAAALAVFTVLRDFGAAKAPRPKTVAMLQSNRQRTTREKMPGLRERVEVFMERTGLFRFVSSSRFGSAALVFFYVSVRVRRGCKAANYETGWAGVAVKNRDKMKELRNAPGRKGKGDAGKIFSMNGEV